MADFPYEDIIDLPHPTSSRHPRMPIADRAAQFSPFSALSGYGEAVQETARVTDRKVELDEYEKAKLDEKLHLIQQNLGEEIEITYFQSDMKKSGGEYLTISRRIKKIDSFQRKLILEDGTEIPMDDVMDLSFPHAMEDTISAKTLSDMGKAVENYKNGSVSPVIDLSDFD